MTRLFVEPVQPVGPDGRRRWRDRVLPATLRLLAEGSNRATGGRAIGLSCRLTGKALAGKDGAVRFDLGGNGVLLVDRRDSLWLRSLLVDRSYEPDVDHLLASMFHPGDGFLDCGANLGIWSIATGHIAGDAGRVVAVEAGTDQYAHLVANNVANDDRFVALHRAVSDASGQEVPFYSAPSDHVSASMLRELAPAGATEENVATIGLRELLDCVRAAREPDGLTFVKLDIEGMETRVLSTFDCASHGDIVVLYEDHGRDQGHATSRLLLDRGFVVAFLFDDGTVERIDAVNIDRLRDLKTNENHGYNLVAVAPGGRAAARLIEQYPEVAPRPPAAAPGKPTVIVGVCTYQRNEPLAALLDGVLAIAEHDRNSTIGVVIVDDTPAGLARDVVKRYVGRFDAGIEYRISGHQNISLARNLVIETALAAGADWIAMTDDDCVPDVKWVQELLAVQRRTGADVISGPEVRVAGPDAPRWLTAEPFLGAGLNDFRDGARIDIGSTHNALLSGAWLRRTPLRFEPDLGKLGGEDMVFFSAARAEGVRIHYARDAVVYETQPAQRATYRYQLKNFWWLGNSQFVTTTRSGQARPARMAFHGVAELTRAALRPIGQLARQRPPQLRFALASAVRATGILAGAAGVRVDHH
ncbi:MAG: FkbM family methyltransferase [Ilumatobacteraceae bacterium]